MKFNVLEKNELQKILINDIKNVIDSGSNPNEILLVTLNENVISSFEELIDNDIPVKYFGGQNVKLCYTYRLILRFHSRARE